jgi:hypothetical protein
VTGHDSTLLSRVPRFLPAGRHESRSATRDFIRIIVSTDVTATLIPRRFGHDVHRITRAETSTALSVPRVSSGAGTFVAWLERLPGDPRSFWWISELFT